MRCWPSVKRSEAAMDEGGEIEGFTSYWDERTGRTDYILLAEIPVKEPWQAMAWLPMGGWNNCPDPYTMMMTARRWYEEYGAWPAAVRPVTSWNLSSSRKMARRLSNRMKSSCSMAHITLENRSTTSE